jgi:hypothetical protein
MPTDSVPQRCNKHTAIAIVLGNILVFLGVMAIHILMSRLGFVYEVLSLYLALSSVTVGLAFLPDKSSGWRSVVASMALAVITATAVVAIHVYFSYERYPWATWWPYGHTVLSAVAVYFCAMVAFYLVRIIESFLQQ